MPEPCDAVLFDFGGVFLDSPFAAVRAYGESLGVDPEQVVEWVFGVYDGDTDHPWHRLERGELALEAAREAILATSTAAGHAVDILSALGTMRGATIRDGMVEAVRAARASGARTALVTNNVREFGDGWRSLLPLADLFDVVVDSHEVGLRKPDPRMFRLALERLGGIAPERAVFLDDFPGNVAAARRLGIRGILVDDNWEPAVAELRSLLT